MKSNYVAVKNMSTRGQCQRSSHVNVYDICSAGFLTDFHYNLVFTMQSICFLAYVYCCKFFMSFVSLGLLGML